MAISELQYQGTNLELRGMTVVTRSKVSPSGLHYRVVVERASHDGRSKVRRTLTYVQPSSLRLVEVDHRRPEEIAGDLLSKLRD